MNDEIAVPGGDTQADPGAAPDTAEVVPTVTVVDEPVPLAAQDLATTVDAPTVIPVVEPGVVPVVPAGLTQIDEEEVPLAVLDEEDLGEEDVDGSEDGQGLREIGDEETPLAQAALAGGVQHHFQHILEVGVSGLLPIFLAGSNRKKKKEVSELKKQLEDGKEN